MNLQNEDAIKEQEMHTPQSITESWVRPETPQTKAWNIHFTVLRIYLNILFTLRHDKNKI